MYGIGILELIILLAIGFLVIVLPVALIVAAIMLLRRQNSSPSSAELMRENQRLREEIARLENRSE